MANGAAASIPLALLSAPADRRRHGHPIDGCDSEAHVTDDGRVGIAVDEDDPQVASLLQALQRRPIPHPSEIEKEAYFPLRLNVVIHVVGSRGDVQPFVALGRALQKQGHRVRLATHFVFRDFVKDNGLEFFNIGGDPAELMSYMVKNPKLIPKMETLVKGTVGRRRGEIRKMIGGCWRSCFESGEGIDTTGNEAITALPFVADAIIANPPSFAHFHCAQKMGVPLHLMFTMPWSPTQAFPHPLANILTHDTRPSVANFVSYILTEMLIWQGVGELINEFRRFELGLDQLEGTGAPSLLHRLRVPFTYLWSPSLLPKPDDWPDHINVTGFQFLPSNRDYTPPQDLADFLDTGAPPLYIGFGSIVVDDPDALTQTILEAVEITGQRAIISKGWGGLGADKINQRDVFFLATGVALGRPTIIVPFFGDQPFWGSLVAQNGAGPPPIPIRNLTADRLASAIHFCLKPDTAERHRSWVRIFEQRTVLAVQ
ncbi:CAZyme family GT1 [Aspergillus niger]|nr:CAZyme family GT1 [Aspergillus niger]KAI3042452.1 CAZyme family GT1 [Aspergillus niger]KAI3045555.1 CAZyme family GT1 [Aspergillus niger]